MCRWCNCNMKISCTDIYLYPVLAQFITWMLPVRWKEVGKCNSAECEETSRHFLDVPLWLFLHLSATGKFIHLHLTKSLICIFSTNKRNKCESWATVKTGKEDTVASFAPMMNSYAPMGDIPIALPFALQQPHAAHYHSLLPC